MKEHAKSRIPENVQEINASLLTDWKEEDHLYYEALFFQSLMEKVEKESITLVVGGPGCGKTATIRHLALKFLSDGFEVVPIEDMQDIISFGDINRKQVFMLDNAFGNIYFKLEFLDKFNQRHYKIKKVLNDQSKLLMTCRKMVMMEAKRFALHSSVLESVFDLEDEENNLIVRDRVSILSNHLHNVSSYTEIEDYVRNTELIPMFPLLCKIFSSSKAYKTEGCNFFRDPCRWILKYLQELEQESRLKYASLVMCMLNRGRLSEDEVEYSSLLPVVRKCCKVNVVGNWEIIDALSDMDGTYVHKTSQTFVFLHDVFLEAVIYHFGKRCPEEIIDKLPTEMISKRLSVNENQSSNCLQICIDPEMFPQLAQRLLRDLEQLQPYSVFESDMLQNRKLCKCFLDILERGSCEDTENFFIEPKAFSTSLILNIEYDPAVDLDFLARSLIENAQSMHDWYEEDYNVRCIRPEVGHIRYLSWVVAYGHVQILQYIIKIAVVRNETSELFGSDIRSQSRYLVLACYSRKPDMVKLVLTHVDTVCVNSIPFQKCNEEEKVPIHCDFTPLKMAVLRGSSSVIDVLLEANVDVSALDENGFSPIYFAIYFSQEHIFEKLIELNANVNHIKDGVPSPLILAAQLNKSKLLKILLNKGANCNYRCASRATALYFASSNNNFESVKSLINFGADVRMYRNRDKSPFCAAAANGHVPIVELLYENGADCNFFDENGIPALCLASKNGHLNIVQFLLEKGTNVNERGDSLFPPLLCAITNEHTTVATTLIQAGANRYSLSHIFTTPLHEAVKTNDVKVVEMLHASDLHYRSRNKEGMTPLEMAVWMNRKEILNLLIKGENDTNNGSGNEHLFRVITDLRSSNLYLNHKDDIEAKDKGEILGVTPCFSVIKDVLERDRYKSLEYLFALGLNSNRKIKQLKHRNFIEIFFVDEPEVRTPLFSFAIMENADTARSIIDHRLRMEPQTEYQRKPFIKCENQFVSKHELWESLDYHFYNDDCYMNHIMDNTDSFLHILQKEINKVEFILENFSELEEADETDYVRHEVEIQMHRDTIKYIKTRRRRHSFP